MSDKWLLKARDGRTFTGDTMVAVVAQLPGYKIDFDGQRYTPTIDDYPVTWGYSGDYSRDEIAREFASDIISKLKHNAGWALYVLKD